MTICILLSTIFWTANSLTKSYEAGITFSLHYKNRPFQSKIEGELPSTVEFIFRESGWNLLSLMIRDLPDSLTVDLSKAIDSSGNISVNTPMSEGWPTPECRILSPTCRRRCGRARRCWRGVEFTWHRRIGIRLYRRPQLRVASLRTDAHISRSHLERRWRLSGCRGSGYLSTWARGALLPTSHFYYWLNYTRVTRISQVV